MNNKKLQLRVAIGLAVMSGLMTTGTVQAGAFQTPTVGAPGWGRAFGGGSLFKNDPSAAFNNPAAMAFIDKNISQFTVDYARISLKYKGSATDFQGIPIGNTTVDPDTFEFSSVPLNGNGGQGGFTAWVPTGFLVMPIGDRFAFGLSQVVPQGMKSTWDEDWKGRDFAVDTKIETVGLTGSLSFKVTDEFSIGGGAIVQHSTGFVSQNIDLSAAAALSPGLGGQIPFPSNLGTALMRVKVDNTSVGWFAGLTWKPTPQDTLGFSYHAKIKNKLEGKYNIYASEGYRELMTGTDNTGKTLVELAYPGLRLFPDGANASTQLDIPATAALDWVHVFNDRFTLGASINWTQWSSFKSLTLKSDGNTIVAIPYKYRDSMMFSLGGDYRLTDEFTVRAGVAFDQTPTRNSTRDPRIPDGDRIFTSLGFGYDIKAIKGLTVDGAYSHQFVEETKLKTQNQDRLGGASLDGKVKAYGDVVSLGVTYAF